MSSFDAASFLTTTDGLITAVWCIATVVFAIVSAVWLYWRTRDVRRQLASALRSPTQIATHSLLSVPWEHYSRSFIAPSGDRKKTDARADRFFSLYTVAGKSMNLRYWGSVPSILVGTGILGTFVGLAFGIGGFDTSDVDAVQKSVERLLGGMSTAFWSSIAGMSCSILFNFFEKLRFKKVEQDLRKLANQLDAQYLLTTADRLRFNREDQQALMLGIFGHRNEDGDMIPPGDVMRDMRRESEEQTRALKSFSSDLADGIMIATETIEALGSKLGSAFEESVREGFGPLLADLKMAVDQLKAERASGNEEMVQNVIAHLATTLEKMGQEFQEALSGSAIRQLESIAATVSATSETLERLPSDLEQMLQSLKDGHIEISRTANEQAEEASRRIQELTEATLETIRDQTRTVVTALASQVRDLQDRSERLIRMQAERTEVISGSIAQMQAVLDEAKAVAQSMGHTMTTVDGIIQKFEGISESVEETTSLLEGAGQALTESATLLRDESETTRVENQRYSSSIRESVESIRNLTQEAANQFDIIRDGLAGIFGELEQGLTRYQEQTREGLNHYLGDFANHLRDAAAALGSSVESLNETFDDLEDILQERRNGNENGHEPAHQ